VLHKLGVEKVMWRIFNWL